MRGRSNHRTLHERALQMITRGRASEHFDNHFTVTRRRKIDEDGDPRIRPCGLNRRQNISGVGSKTPSNCRRTGRAARNRQPSAAPCQPSPGNKGRM